jgi:two-component system, response regulator PdtaR
MTEKLIALVVEDEPLQLMMTCDIVEDAGLSPIHASNADQALKILESRDDIRVLVTDVNMPGSINGAKLASVVDQRWPEIELVVIAGQTERPAIPQRSCFFNKPYPVDKVIKTLRALALNLWRKRKAKSQLTGLSSPQALERTA